jgi:hypothetical protein
MDTVPLYLMSPQGNRELAVDLTRRATGLPEVAAHSIVLTLDAVSAAVLRTPGVVLDEARAILAALWQQPERIASVVPPRLDPARPGSTGWGPDYLTGLGERIHVIRRARRLTITGLRHRIGLSVADLRDLEAGVAWPSLPVLVRIADAFQVPVPLLVDERATPLRILRLLNATAA